MYHSSESFKWIRFVCKHVCVTLIELSVCYEIHSLYATFICLVIGDRERGSMADGDWSVDLRWCPWIGGGGVLRSGGVRIGVVGVLVCMVGVVSTSVGSDRGVEGSGARGLLRSR